MSINLLYNPHKENLPKVNSKVQKGHGFTFSLKLSQLDPYIHTVNVFILIEMRLNVEMADIDNN